MIRRGKATPDQKPRLKPLAIMKLNNVVKGDRFKHLSMLSNCPNGCCIDFEVCASLQLLDDCESRPPRTGAGILFFSLSIPPAAGLARSAGGS
jgi:hypothetical protein